MSVLTVIRSKKDMRSWRIAEWIRMGISNLFGGITIEIVVGFIICQLKANTTVVKNINY